MGRKFNGLIDRILFRRSLRRYGLLADAAPAMDLASVRRARARAWALRRQLDRVIHTADHRLALPVIGSNAIRSPVGSDWVWRPMPWQQPIAVPGLAPVPGRAEVCTGITLFHDCPLSELVLRQQRNSRDGDLAPFGLRLDVFRFEGSFLSLAIDLPPEAAEGLKSRHLIRLDAIVEVERPLGIFARLNIRQGPNVEQVVRELPQSTAGEMVEFDLAYIRMNEKRADKLWIDLIFEAPGMNQIVLRDVTLSRRPRAAL